MNRLPKFLLGMLVLTLVLGVATPLLAAEAAGKIKSVNADKLEFTILDANQKNWTFHLAKDAKVFINDKEGKLSDLQADNAVTITYQDENGKLMASQVRCTRK
jgi:biopolymer transport protein ExbD